MKDKPHLNVIHGHAPVTPALLSALVSGNLANVAAAASPGGIEAQELAGQMDQASKDTLPRELKPSRADWEKVGFRFGKVVEEIFMVARFPQGWVKKPTGHSMWTDLVDGKGRKRGAIFYKAAFYDRHAYAYLCPRFSVGKRYPDGVNGASVSVSVEDACGVVDGRAKAFPQPDWHGAREAALEADTRVQEYMHELDGWLTENFPGWESPTAHWVE